MEYTQAKSNHRRSASNRPGDTSHTASDPEGQCLLRIDLLVPPEDFLTASTDDGSYFPESGLDFQHEVPMPFSQDESTTYRFILWMSSDCFRAMGLSTEHALLTTQYGQLIKFRKPAKLFEWLLRREAATRRVNRTRHAQCQLRNESVVVTSWKNAKSCLAAIADSRFSPVVTLFVILCNDGVNALANANMWLAALPEAITGNILLAANLLEAQSSILLWRYIKDSQLI